ncbi:MAG: hypothetical protein AB1578_10180 [Thermodesulfobacteriota bacterium]|jgi:uncharacterized Zn finger protein (UPF0148 family)
MALLLRRHDAVRRPSLPTILTGGRTMVTVDIECPRCKVKFAWPLAEVLPGRVMECPRCGFETAFTARDVEAVRESAARVGGEQV